MGNFVSLIKRQTIQFQVVNTRHKCIFQFLFKFSNQHSQMLLMSYLQSHINKIHCNVYLDHTALNLYDRELG